MLYIFRSTSNIIRWQICLAFLFIFSSFILSQNLNNNEPLSSERYITDQNGNILINVNLWGHVANPGTHLVYDGIDLATLLSVAGGPLPGANLKQIKIIRSNSSTEEKIMHIINVDKFYSYGDKTDFVKIMPNDTVVIKEKFFHNLLSKTNLFSNILQLISLYIQISLLSDN